MTKKTTFLLILNLSLIAAFFVGTAEESIEGVWTVRLRDFYLDYHAPAVALACPGVDYIKLWSLLVEGPWEGPTDRPWPGWFALAKRPRPKAGSLV